MKNNYYKYIFIIILIAIEAIIIVVFFKWNSRNSDLYAWKYINNIFVGNLSEKTITEKDKYFIAADNDKDVKKPSENSKNVYLAANSASDTQLSIVNNTGLTDFEILKEIDNKSLVNIVYNNIANSLEFFVPSRDLIINSQTADTKGYLLYSLKDIGPNSIVRFNDEMIDVDNYSGNLFIAINKIINADIYVYKPTINIIERANYSFEEGAWTRIANDCSNTNMGEPKISMNISDDATDGDKSILLSSENHHACTSKSFNIRMDKAYKYKLSFDYKNLTGGKVQYYYNLSNSNKNNSYKLEVFAAENHRWNNFQTLLDNGLENFNKIDIFLYAPSDGKNKVANAFDNIQLLEYRPVDKYEIKLDQKFITQINKSVQKNVSIAQGNNVIKFDARENIIEDSNTSFEDGLWKEKVDDCSKDATGSPAMAMDLSEDSMEGKYSLKLKASSHIACTSKIFPVKMLPQNKYKLSFYYKNIKGGRVQFYYNIRNNKANGSAKTQYIAVNDSEWHKYETEIETMDNIQDLVVFFYAAPENGEEIENLYDNIQLAEYAANDLGQYVLHANQKIDDTMGVDVIEYNSVNIFQVIAKLHNVKKSFLLTMPDRQYSDYWQGYPIIGKKEEANMTVPQEYSIFKSEHHRQADKKKVEEYIDSGKISAIGNDKIFRQYKNSIENYNMPRIMPWVTWVNKPIDGSLHYKINNYGNAWWIDIDDLCKTKNLCRQNADGTFDIDLVVENKWNKILQILFAGSGIVWFGCVWHLAAGWSRKRGQGRKNNRTSEKYK